MTTSCDAGETASETLDMKSIFPRPITLEDLTANYYGDEIQKD
jgi:hypothetical protein